MAAQELLSAAEKPGLGGYRSSRAAGYGSQCIYDHDKRALGAFIYS